MEVTHRLDDLHKKVYKQRISIDDLKFIKSSLSSQCPDDIIIKRFDKQDSGKLYLTILASTISKIMLVAIKSEISRDEILDNILLKLYEFLFQEASFNSSLCYLEYVRIKRETNKVILEILSSIITEAVEEKMKYFLANKDDRDIFGINFSLIVRPAEKIANKECRTLNAKKLDVQFLEVLCTLKTHMTKENLRIIFNLAKNKLLKNNKEETQILLAIISEVNVIAKEKCMDILEVVPEIINETYLGFLYSLMVDQESIERVWDLLNEFNIIHDIMCRLKTVRELLHEENLDLYHSDVFFVQYGVSIINIAIQNIKESKSFFITHSDSFLNLLWTNLSNNVLSALFEYCTLLIYDEEIQAKIYEYFLHLDIFNQEKKSDLKIKSNDRLFFYNSKTIYSVLDEESKNNSFELTTWIVNLCSKLLNYGMFEKEIYEYFNVAIKSSNPEILLIILQKLVDKKYPITENIVISIKSGIEKNGNLCDSFLKFCITNSKQESIRDVFKLVSDNINFMYLIFSSQCNDFFKFIENMDVREISVFIGDDFLDRISDNVQEGLEYLISKSKDNLDLCNFIIKKSSFFNNLSGFGEQKLKLYEILSNNCSENFECSFDKKDNSVFIIPEIQTNEFFNIISSKIYQEPDNSKALIVRKYVYTTNNITGYCNYLKTLLSIGINVENEVKNIITLNVESENIAELVGYYRAMKNFDIKYNYTPKKLVNIILCKLGTFDNEFFVKKFDQASSYEKFLLFFLLDLKTINEDIFKIIIKEINTLVMNGPFSHENKPLLTHCLNSMAYSKSVSQVIKAFNGIEVPDEYVDPLVRINIVGLVNYEKEMLNMKLISRASLDLQVKVCVLSFFNKTLNNEILRELVFSLRRSVVDESMEFIYKEMQRIEMN